MREKTVEDYLVERVEALGGEIRKVKWVGRRKAPDRRVMLPGRGCWVELKAPGKKPDRGQAREHKRMRDCGDVVLVIDSKELVDLHFPLGAQYGGGSYQIYGEPVQPKIILDV